MTSGKSGSQDSAPDGPPAWAEDVHELMQKLVKRGVYLIGALSDGTSDLYVCPAATPREQKRLAFFLTDAAYTLMRRFGVETLDKPWKGGGLSRN